jgi:sugar diacid utilization regulator
MTRRSAPSSRNGAPPGDRRPDDPVRRIAERIAERSEELARRMVSRYRDDIVDYRLADEEFVFGDVFAVSLDNIEVLFANLIAGRPTADEQLDATRRGAARRLQHGISLEAFLHASRLWGQLTWETVLQTAALDEPAEREAALEIAGHVMNHVDKMSVAVAAAYLAEAEGVSSDREVVRRDLLDALISGKGETDRIRRLARSLRLQLSEQYVVALIRGDDAAVEETPGQPSTSGIALRRVVEAARAHLRPTAGSLLVGMRQGEVVALYPVEQAAGTELVKQECSALAQALADEALCVGIGGSHAGLAAIGVGYAEASEAVEIALSGEVRGRAVAFDEVLIDHMVRSSPHGDRIVAGTLQPLIDYDAERQAELVPTLRAYVASSFNLTRSAEVLCVHPNTVVYRLRRIRELSGRDPHDPDDLLLLYLGLKLIELGAAR